jgi:hypothetical protein
MPVPEYTIRALVELPVHVERDTAPTKEEAVKILSHMTPEALRKAVPFEDGVLDAVDCIDREDTDEEFYASAAFEAFMQLGDRSSEDVVTTAVTLDDLAKSVGAENHDRCRVEAFWRRKKPAAAVALAKARRTVLDALTAEFVLDAIAAEFKVLAALPSTPAAARQLAEERLRLSEIIGLCADYDGFNTVEDLKSLIDDVARIAKGEMRRPEV